MYKDTTLHDFMRSHTCLVEDLIEAGKLLEKRRPILAGSLSRYADELKPYDHYLAKEWESPFDDEDTVNKSWVD